MRRVSRRFRIFWIAARLVPLWYRGTSRAFGLRQFIAALIYFGVRRVSRRFRIFWIAVRPRTALELRHALVSQHIRPSLPKPKTFPTGFLQYVHTHKDLYYMKFKENLMFMKPSRFCHIDASVTFSEPPFLQKTFICSLGMCSLNPFLEEVFRYASEGAESHE